MTALCSVDMQKRGSNAKPIQGKNDSSNFQPGIGNIFDDPFPIIKRKIKVVKTNTKYQLSDTL
jgi:hypothetical protein